MKKSILLAILLINAFTFISARDGKNKKAVEIEVRNLDSLHAAAVLSGELKELDKYWTEDFIVTNPFSEVDRADRIRNG